VNPIKHIATGAALLLAVGAQAQTISSYDIANARLSGFGNWNHTYSGVIGGGNPTSYTGGSGTLNDGIIATSHFNNQLFWKPDGVSITLYLDGFYKINTIDLLGGNTLANNIPGTLTGWTVTINSNSQSFSSTAHGAACLSGLCDDVVSLIGSGLDTLSTNTIVLSNFTGGWPDESSYFNISEIQVNGASVSAVPEPETYAMMLAGLGLLGFAARRRKAKAAA
jgi:PEP-CTERM motif